MREEGLLVGRTEGGTYMYEQSSKCAVTNLLREFQELVKNLRK